MPWEQGLNLISKAYEKTAEDKLWQMWLMRYANMTKDTFMPFSEFCKLHQEPTPEVKKSTEELLKEAKAIRKDIEKTSALKEGE